jgi:hypothetical protein
MFHALSWATPDHQKNAPVAIFLVMGISRLYQQRQTGPQPVPVSPLGCVAFPEVVMHNCSGPEKITSIE